MRIGVDAMGGDYAPGTAVLGALDAARLLQDSTIVLFGNKEDIEQIMSTQSSIPSNIEIVHTSEVIEMRDSPTSAFSKKTDSSIVVGFGHLQKGLVDAFASAGSTGAMMVGCMYMIKAIDGVLRPTIATPLPTFGGKQFLLLDAGLNIDAKPEVLCQYGVLGSIYAESVLGVKNPRVALLNIGEESEKGNILTKATYHLMEDGGYNFIGNIEGKLMLHDAADVIVCDGFIGNIILKLLESFHPVLEKENVPSLGWFTEGINYETFGGTPVLGVNAPVIIGHGCSSQVAIKNMIKRTYEVATSSMIKDIREKLN